MEQPFDFDLTINGATHRIVEWGKTPQLAATKIINRLNGNTHFRLEYLPKKG